MLLRKTLITLLALLLLVSACGGDDEDDETRLPNPASVFCIEQGGTLEVREGDAGQYGVCIFGDGSECEEWAFFRGECAAGE